jgi:hypothetical protein
LPSYASPYPNSQHQANPGNQVFITIPILIYQVAVPMWSRSQRLSSIYAFLSIDILFTILWLAAFAAVAAWVRGGIEQGATNAKITYSAANCTVFAYGTETKCHLGNAATGFGVVVSLLFAGTAAISVLFFLKMRRDPAGEDPWLAPSSQGGAYKPPQGDLEEGRQSKDPIWDPNFADPNVLPDEDEHIEEMRIEQGGDQPADEYAPLHSTETDEGRHPGRRWDAPMGPPVDTGYHGAAGGGNYRAPSALSPSSHGYPTPGGAYEGGYQAPPRYTFSPESPIPIPDPGDAAMRREQ